MSLLSDGDRRKVSEMLAAMRGPVRLVFFTQTINCETCLPARQILDEIAPLSDNLTVEEHNLALEPEVAAAHGVDRVPAVVVAKDGAARIRFLGVPAGYEFMSLLDAIVLVSTGESGLSEASRALAAGVERPGVIRVFVTPG
jgi:alkyl hydroperoxide reductase subunit AhpF